MDRQRAAKNGTHHHAKCGNDVSDFFIYEFDFAVLIEEIRIRLILPESLLSFEYSSPLIIFVFAKSFNQYSVS